jgi:hypothetical protein
MLHLDMSLRKKEICLNYIDLCPCIAPDWERDLLHDLGRTEDASKGIERRQTAVRKGSVLF